jgi:hypothetical protein
VDKMAFIAPITHFDYSQYVIRETSKPYSPYPFVPVGKVGRVHNLLQGGQQNGSHSSLFNTKLPKKENERLQIQNEAIYSELTGKGKYFNATV